MVLSCTSDAFSLAPDLYFSLERPRPGVVPFDSMGRLGVDPFGVKPLVGLAGATPSSIILSCCWSSLTENVSEWKDNRSLLDPGTRSLSRGITSLELANWKKSWMRNYYFESWQYFGWKTFLIATDKQLAPLQQGSHYPLLQRPVLDSLALPKMPGLDPNTLPPYI